MSETLLSDSLLKVYRSIMGSRGTIILEILFTYFSEESTTKNHQDQTTPVSSFDMPLHTHTHIFSAEVINKSLVEEKKNQKQRARERNRDGSEHERLCFQKYWRLLMQYSPLLPVASLSLNFLNTTVSDLLNETTQLFTSGFVWFWEVAQLHLPVQKNLTATNIFHFSSNQLAVLVQC